MSYNIAKQPFAVLTGSERIIFRIVFLFLLLLSIPFEPSYYRSIFSIDFSGSAFQNLFQLTYHIPGVIHSADWGWQSYEGWLWTLVMAGAGAVTWQQADKERRDFSHFYYWLRTILRYRLALGIIAYGIVLLVPVQFPQPSLSELYSPYGAFLPWKIYYHTTAVASAGYRQTIGAIEVIAGTLLLYRRTVPIGALAISFILVNVVLANFAYDIGEHLYSSYLLLIALILLAHDLPRLYQLLITGTKVLAETYEPRFNRNVHLLRKGVRIGFTVFFLLLGALTFARYSTSNWPYSDKPGLPDAAGFYDVAFFKVNDSIHPYSLSDSVRWKDVVLEKWNVLSVRTNRWAPVNFLGPSIRSRQPLSEHYQFEGNGGRNFYTYEYNGNVITLIGRNDHTDTLRFSVLRPNAATIELRGKNQLGDSLTVALNKVDKEYLLFKGRRKPVSIN